MLDLFRNGLQTKSEICPSTIADFVYKFCSKPYRPSFCSALKLILQSFPTGSEPTILKYKQNEAVRYKIEGFTSIHLPNSLKGESTKLTYTGGFELSPENECTFVLKVSNVEVVGPDGKVNSVLIFSVVNWFQILESNFGFFFFFFKKHTDNSLIGRPAKFSWHNGKLESLCLDKEESEVAANFKRSIIANLQVSSWGNPVTRAIPTDGSSVYEVLNFSSFLKNFSPKSNQMGNLNKKKKKDLWTIFIGIGYGLKNDH